jgi:hypothetical protein
VSLSSVGSSVHPSCTRPSFGLPAPAVCAVSVPSCAAMIRPIMGFRALLSQVGLPRASDCGLRALPLSQPAMTRRVMGFVMSLMNTILQSRCRVVCYPSSASLVGSLVTLLLLLTLFIEEPHYAPNAHASRQMQMMASRVPAPPPSQSAAAVLRHPTRGTSELPVAFLSLRK